MEEELNLFHSTDYLECLKRLSEEDDDEKHGEDAETYGLSKKILPVHITVQTYFL